MKLSEVPLHKLRPGIHVIGATSRANGVVTDVSWNPHYKVGDGERNPWITIKWEHGGTSTDTIDFMDKVTVVEEAQHNEY